MNDQEKQILHGLYFSRGQIVGELISHRSEEIIWLMNTKIPETANWRQVNGGFQRMDIDNNGNYLVDISKGRGRAKAPLSYLNEAGYIKYEIVGDLFNLSVTAKGAEMARELNTSIGRLNLWHKEHKEGIIGIFLVILISVLTTLLTNLFTESHSDKKVDETFHKSNLCQKQS